MKDIVTFWGALAIVLTASIACDPGTGSRNNKNNTLANGKGRGDPITGPRTAAAARITKPHLYKLTKNDTTIFLLGTMHVGVDISDLPTYIEQLLLTSDLSLHEAKSVNLGSDKTDQYVYLKDQKLSSLISEKAFTNFTTEVSKAKKVDQTTLEQFQPWAADALYIKACVVSLKQEPLDKQLEKRAIDKKISDEELDDFELEMKRGTSAETAKSASSEMENSCANILSDTQKILQVYISGDESALMALDTVKQDQANDVIDRRNQLWLPKIINATQAHKKIFIFVGAAHLYQGNGLLSLLQNDGFNVSRCSEKGC